MYLAQKVNVKNAKPLFQGHYEPHIPHHRIGYYDLLNIQTLIDQHALAQAYHINAFCYYYYNFAGHKVLERPLIKINRSAQIHNKFCLCWVHTSWYDNRKAPNHPFIEQEYSDKNAVELFYDLKQYFENQRYLKIDGRPLLAIWAPERHPLIQMYAEILNYLCLKQLGVKPFLAGVEAYLAAPPQTFGLDAMIEFAPSWLKENHVSKEGEQPVRIDYQKTLDFMLHKEKPNYLRLRCTFPSWDNTPRRGREGIACVGNTPEAFALALDQLCQYTMANLPPNLQYIFLNAWNEWGEGCHLEPDEYYGFTYLKLIKEIAEKYNKTS